MCPHTVYIAGFSAEDESTAMLSRLAQYQLKESTIGTCSFTDIMVVPPSDEPMTADETTKSFAVGAVQCEAGVKDGAKDGAKHDAKDEANDDPKDEAKGDAKDNTNEDVKTEAASGKAAMDEGGAITETESDADDAAVMREAPARDIQDEPSSKRIKMSL